MLILTLLGCAFTADAVSPPGVILPSSVSSCVQDPTGWTCVSGHFEVGLSISSYGLVNGKSVAHPVATCTFHSFAVEEQWMLHHHCQYKNIRYLKTLSWSTEQASVEQGEALLGQVRFTALEEACVAKTGAACP